MGKSGLGRVVAGGDPRSTVGRRGEAAASGGAAGGTAMISAWPGIEPASAATKAKVAIRPALDVGMPDI